MQAFFNTSFQIGRLSLSNRLIQGPLAGFSCAPFREQVYAYTPPAYCVSEMISAYDVLHKHQSQSRYIHRSAKETCLAYQISGDDPDTLAKAAVKLEGLGADLIDINCGCPKTKIRKKGAGSALLDKPDHLKQIVETVRDQLSIPLTIKLRIQGGEADIHLARQLEDAGADALIVHGRRWVDDYDVSSDFKQIAEIKKAVQIPVIANGDISDFSSLKQAWQQSACDGFMISRAGTGRPWLFSELLSGDELKVSLEEKKHRFMQHLAGLANLETEYKAVLQSKSLLRYYFRGLLSREAQALFYGLTQISEIHDFIQRISDSTVCLQTG